MNSSINNAHRDLLEIKSLVYTPCGFECSKVVLNPESALYGACTFTINGRNVQFRVAKITPKKTGQFVTLWKRIGKGPTMPFDASDNMDFFVISAKKNNSFGQFIFPKSILVAKNIFSSNCKGGKRGIRIYPPWDKTTNHQAQKTQKWQLKYFLDMTLENSIDNDRARTLYSNS